jgi:hypothetical protein
MFVLCGVSKHKKAKYRTIKTKKQVWMKYTVEENTKRLAEGPRFSAPVQTSPGAHPI